MFYSMYSIVDPTFTFSYVINHTEHKVCIHFRQLHLHGNAVQTFQINMVNALPCTNNVSCTKMKADVMYAVMDYSELSKF